MTTRAMPIAIPDDVDAAVAEAYVRAVNAAIHDHADKPDAAPLIAAVVAARRIAARDGLEESACDEIDRQVQGWWEALARAERQAGQVQAADVAEAVVTQFR